MAVMSLGLQVSVCVACLMHVRCTSVRSLRDGSVRAYIVRHTDHQAVTYVYVAESMVL